MTDTFQDTLSELFREASIEHKLPGRLRIRIHSKQGDVEYFKRLVARLSKYDAIEEIRANPRTGSVLIRHTLNGAELDRLAASVPGPANGKETQKRGLPPASREDVAASALQMLSVLQLGRGRVMGSAVESAWYSYQLARQQIQVLTPVFAGLALLQLARRRMLSPAATMFMYSLLLRRNR